MVRKLYIYSSLDKNHQNVLAENVCMIVEPLANNKVRLLHNDITREPLLPH